MESFQNRPVFITKRMSLAPFLDMKIRPLLELLYLLLGMKFRPKIVKAFV